MSNQKIIITEELAQLVCQSEYDRTMGSARNFVEKEYEDCRCSEIPALEVKNRELEREKAEQFAIVSGIGDIICGNGVNHKQDIPVDTCLYCEIKELEAKVEELKEKVKSQQASLRGHMQENKEEIERLRTALEEARWFAMDVLEKVPYITFKEKARKIKEQIESLPPAEGKEEGQ